MIVTSVMENPKTEPERGRPCFVRHPDAGGACGRPAAVGAFGLSFCEVHGEELAAENSLTEDLGRALVRAYPDVPEGVRASIRHWERDEGPHRDAVAETLLGSLGTLQKLMRLAHEDGQAWVVENLELERESVAAQAAYAWRELVGDRPAE